MAPTLSTLRPLKAGDVIFDLHRPLIHVLYPEFKGIHCDYCLQKPPQLTNCSVCNQMFYCDNKNCQTIDYKFHKNECKVFKNKEEVFRFGEMEPILKILIRLLIAIKSDKTFVTKTYPMSDGLEISLKDIEVNVEALSSDTNAMVIFRLFCKEFNKYGLEFEPEELFHWFALILIKPGCYPLRHLTLIETSFETLKLGFGFYIQLCSLSHSCSPNSALIPNDLSIQMRAMEPIDSGSEITISYAKVLRGYDDPHKQLKDIFHIDCDCQKFKDYKFERLLSKLFELLTRNMDPFGDRAMPDVCPIVEKIFTTGEQFMGYHPDLSSYFLIQLYGLFRIKIYGNENRIKAKSEYFKRLDKHLLITFGEEHKIYRHFQRYRYIVFPMF